MNILVTGGAGYIGSHTVKELISQGHHVIVYDNLSKGHREAVPDGIFIAGDTNDREVLTEVLCRYSIEAVIHFAAYSLVGESAVNPAMYFHNNVTSTLCLLDTMLDHGVKNIVFSSTAAVYGEPTEIPISENCLLKPTNVYGISKLMVEQILQSYGRAYGLSYMSLRYFNAAGAHWSGNIGEDHNPESHLVPLVLQAALGQRENIRIFGTDYNTPDGTCIRDYIHVADLAEAHILALKALKSGYPPTAYNLGNGKGFSVREVIETAGKVTGSAIKVIESERREGDPNILIASSEKIKKELGWQPRFKYLSDIIASAWNWHSNHPLGFQEEMMKLFN